MTSAYPSEAAMLTTRPVAIGALIVQLKLDYRNGIGRNANGFCFIENCDYRFVMIRCDISDMSDTADFQIFMATQ